MKTLLKKIWKWIKSFTIKHQVIILKLLNYIVLFSIYAMNDGNLGIETITGLWIFLNLAIDSFKIFMKK